MKEFLMRTDPVQSTRRQFLATTGTALAGAAIGFPLRSSVAQEVRPVPPKGVEVIYPRGRVPLSFIIDDSTCLVNIGHFCTPQFLSCYPDRPEYQKDWKKWPREIPDAFVREFGEWCAEHGVKGKYSIVPNPACVGWMDRELPGWSRSELQSSLKLVRDLMLPNWDIHPEMITHTRVIDLKTGRPFDEISPATMENSYPREKKSVDELAAYLAYALQILKNCDLPCEGVTTPGGFGNLVKPELSLAVQQSVRDVYRAEIPHFFKYVNYGEREHRTNDRAPQRAWHRQRQPDGQHSGRNRRLVRRLAGRHDVRLAALLKRRRDRGPHGGSDPARRAGSDAVPLAGHVQQRHEGRLQLVSACRHCTGPPIPRSDDLDEAQRDRSLLGGKGVDLASRDRRRLLDGRAVCCAWVHCESQRTTGGQSGGCRGRLNQAAAEGFKTSRACRRDVAGGWRLDHRVLRSAAREFSVEIRASVTAQREGDVPRPPSKTLEIKETSNCS